MRINPLGVGFCQTKPLLIMGSIGSKRDSLGGKFKFEEGFEVHFYVSETFCTPISWDYKGTKDFRISDDRYQQVKAFAQSVLELYIQAFNKKETNEAAEKSA
jgi:hypothetical protein